MYLFSTAKERQILNEYKENGSDYHSDLSYAKEKVFKNGKYNENEMKK